MKPLVSVCIPAYNAELFIQETLESVLIQKYENIEIIISDDCSSDRTVEIVSNYLNQGVKLIKNKQNLGRYENCNMVIKNSFGKYILKLDADDLIDPDHIQEQVNVMESDPLIAFAHCACRLIDIKGNFLGYERSINGSFIRSIIEEWPRYVDGPKAVNIVMIRRSAFDLTGGYNENYKYSGDWAMHRSLLMVGKVFYNDKVIASYRVHDHGKEGIKLLQAKEHLMHLKEIERTWPNGVDCKDFLIKKARIKNSINLAFSAAFVSRKERDEIIVLLPLYGNHMILRFMILILKVNGGFILRFIYKFWLFCRNFLKFFLYKSKSI